MTARRVIWFRRDLRVTDNPALASVLAEPGAVVPVFIFDRPLLASKVFGDGCVAFMLDSLRDLADALGRAGMPLQWRVGDPREEIPRLARDLKAEAVWWNRDYEPGAVARDQHVSRALAEQRICVRTCKDHLVFEPDQLRNVSGQPFQRYSAFRTAWWKQWHAEAVRSPGGGLPLVAARAAAPAPFPLPSAQDLGYDTVIPWMRGGEQAGAARLRAFVGGALHRYVTGRNRPGSDETSILSPHFRFGTLNPRTAIRAALERLHGGGAVSRPDVYTWIDELIWREFFHHVMAGFPHVADGPFRPSASVAPARRPDDLARTLFRAWCEGRTGYPLVDAGMRQLNQTGWMHNRVRMVVASFLVKDLRLDWRWGERYFMGRLVDADLAVNNGNWQWCASTGTDAMPGYRIFNPTLQGKKFDPDGAYVRRYVPELAKVPTAAIHAPWDMSRDLQERAGCRIGADYPRPIVDHERARREYLELAGAERGRAHDN